MYLDNWKNALANEHLDKQAGAELGQAQPKLKWRLRLNDTE